MLKDTYSIPTHAPTLHSITLLDTQHAKIESPIFCGTMGPALLMRANLIEHPACYLCLHQAVSRFTLHTYYITSGPIH